MPTTKQLSVTQWSQPDWDSLPPSVQQQLTLAGHTVIPNLVEGIRVFVDIVITINGYEIKIKRNELTKPFNLTKYNGQPEHEMMSLIHTIEKHGLAEVLKHAQITTTITTNDTVDLLA